jgi:hypothetical protein
MQVSNSSHRLSQAELFTLPADIITGFSQQMALWEFQTAHFFATFLWLLAVVVVEKTAAAVAQAESWNSQASHSRPINQLLSEQVELAEMVQMEHKEIHPHSDH